MSNQTRLELAIAGREHVPPDWMSATRVRPFIFEDPAVVWLEYHGEKHGFLPDTSPYEFLDFIGEKGRQFEGRWVKEMAPNAIRVCAEAYDVRLADKVRETFGYIEKGIPVIAQPALWWAPERIYGVPDLLVHTSWIKERFPGLLSAAGREEGGGRPEVVGESDHYVVFDVKFTTKLDETKKARDLANYAAQLRIYSYILGNVQGYMPRMAYLFARDRISEPICVPILPKLSEPLDADLAEIRDHFVEIKVKGAKYAPWKDSIVASNISQDDDRWRTAKEVIAREKVPGMDPGLLYQIGSGTKRNLNSMGFPNLNSMLEVDPNDVPFEKCKGLGPTKSKQIRAILQANKSGSPLLPPSVLIPPQRQFEFYIDFEFFTNVNVNFDTQWPTLDGCEMIFMVGVGWEDRERWSFATFIGAAEDQNQERQMLEKFLEFLKTQTNTSLADPAKTALYHWSNAEVWQARRASDRQQFPDSHSLRNLPWCDLQKVFLNSPCSIPGAWNYGLKEVAKALGNVNPEFDPTWPGDLDAGLRAMVMGWKAYEATDPLRTEEMNTLSRYLEADCRALWNVLKWMRP